MAHLKLLLTLPPVPPRDLGNAVDEAMVPFSPDLTNWLLGGRFAGHFALKPGSIDTSEVCRGQRCPQGRADGGVLAHLDLDGMRKAAVATARAAYGRWRAIDTASPGALPLGHFQALHCAAPSSYPLHRARADFRAQPQVVTALAEHLVASSEDPVTLLASEEYAIARAAGRALTSNGLFALVDQEGHWHADPATWSEAAVRESDEFHQRMSDYLSALDPRSAVVVLDVTP